MNCLMLCETLLKQYSLILIFNFHHHLKGIKHLCLIWHVQYLFSQDFHLWNYCMLHKIVKTTFNRHNSSQGGLHKTLIFVFAFNIWAPFILYHRKVENFIECNAIKHFFEFTKKNLGKLLGKTFLIFISIMKI